MLLARVVETWRRVAGTPGRLAKIDLLAGVLKECRGDEVEIVVSFLCGRTRHGRIGVGWAALRDATAPAAEAPSLDVADVDRRLVKGASLKPLLALATHDEQQFLTGLLMGELRQGALDGLMVEAVAKAANAGPERVRRAAMMAGDIAEVAGAVLESGTAALDRYDVQLFRPVQPMLAQTAEDVSEALSELGEAALEFKFDGARVQAHRSGDEVAVFSRSMKDVSGSAPEIVEAVRALPGRDLILDGEVISLREDGRPQPFQVTARRFGRKIDVERMRAELPLTPFWFDLLYLDGQSLMDEAQGRRFSLLEGLVPAPSLVPHTVTGDPDRAEEFLRDALARGHEGIMAKATAANYAAGARGQSWLKIKQARTLDLVILAAEWGHGRRHGWLSNLHLGAPDLEKGGFAMLGKTFKGLTDAVLAWQTEQLLRIEIGRDKWTVYVEPKLVAEIAFNEIQVSPRYPSGLALRFARVKRYRTDKTAADADSFQTVQKLAGIAAA